MIRKISLVVALFMLALSLGACNSKKSDSQAMTYVEKEIGANSGLKMPSCSRINSQNQLVVYDMAEIKSARFVTLDDSGKAVNEIKCQLEGRVSSFAMDGQDNIYALVDQMKQGSTNENQMKQDSNAQNKMVYKGQGAKQEIVIIDPQGKIKNKFEISINQKEGPMGVQDIAVDSSDNIYIAGIQQGIDVYDQTGKKQRNIDAKCGSIDIDRDGNIIAYIMDLQKMGIQKINPTSGQKIWDKSLANNGGMIKIGGGGNKVRCMKNGNNIYFIKDNTIEHYDSDGNLQGTVLDLTTYNILATGYNISDVNIDSSKNVYILTSSAMVGKSVMMNGDGNGPVGGKNSNSKMGGNRESIIKGEKAPANTKKAGQMNPEDFKFEIYRYSLEKKDNVGEEKVITVSVKRQESFIQTAASRFQKDHPGYKIKLESIPNGQSQDERQKYISNLNTSILAGKGPDIFNVSLLPYEKYVSKNILANLEDFMNKDKNFDKSEYFTNIIEGMRVNQGIYAMPLSFYFNTLIANQDVLDKENIKIDDSKWTWKDFMNIAQKLTKTDSSGNITQSAIPRVSYSDLLGYFMIRGNLNGFIDKENKKANFNSQEFIDILNMIKALGDSQASTKGVKQGQVDVDEAISRGSVIMKPDAMQDYMMYNLDKTLFNSNVSILNFPTIHGNSDHGFLADQVYAINNNSKNKDMAWEFIKYLLSEEIQSGMDLNGFSINKSALKTRADETIENTTHGNIKIARGGSTPITPKALTQADVDIINAFIPTLTKYTNLDDEIVNIVQDETSTFFSGDKTAGQVAQLIQSRVEKYLGE
ncbi:MAG: extracellular solute-binding protein [Clostridia bacterium]|nr:extracellular solute-binding protein [Clostridia bacterium]